MNFKQIIKNKMIDYNQDYINIEFSLDNSRYLPLIEGNILYKLTGNRLTQKELLIEYLDPSIDENLDLIPVILQIQTTTNKLLNKSNKKGKKQLKFGLLTEKVNFPDLTEAKSITLFPEGF